MPCRENASLDPLFMRGSAFPAQAHERDSLYADSVTADADSAIF
jgi:hypothetical protein